MDNLPSSSRMSPDRPPASVGPNLASGSSGGGPAAGTRSRTLTIPSEPRATEARSGRPGSAIPAQPSGVGGRLGFGGTVRPDVLEFGRIGVAGLDQAGICQLGYEFRAPGLCFRFQGRKLEAEHLATHLGGRPRERPRRDRGGGGPVLAPPPARGPPR